MRISIVLIVFLVLLHGWGGLLQQYGLDDHLGINAEMGDASELENATANPTVRTTDQAAGQTLLFYYNRLLRSVADILAGWNNGVQIIVNLMPPGAAKDLVLWGFSAMPVIIAVDLLIFARGTEL